MFQSWERMWGENIVSEKIEFSEKEKDKKKIRKISSKEILR